MSWCRDCSSPLLASPRQRRQQQLRPRPMRYVTGPSPVVSSCCHHLFIFLRLLILPADAPGLISISLARTSRRRRIGRWRRSGRRGGVVLLLMVLGLKLISANTKSCHACSGSPCFMMKNRSSLSGEA